MSVDGRETDGVLFDDVFKEFPNAKDGR